MFPAIHPFNYVHDVTILSFWCNRSSYYFELVRHIAFQDRRRWHMSFKQGKFVMLTRTNTLNWRSNCSARTSRKKHNCSSACHYTNDINSQILTCQSCYKSKERKKTSTGFFIKLVKFCFWGSVEQMNVEEEINEGKEIEFNEHGQCLYSCGLMK